MFLILFLLNFAHAEEWLCEETTGHRNDNVIYSCGSGDGLTQGEARARALKDAFREFHDICEESDDCKGRAKTVEPKRTACKKDPRGFFTCYRLIVTTLAGNGNYAEIESRLPAPRGLQVSVQTLSDMAP